MFLRKLQNSYGIFMNLILTYFATEDGDTATDERKHNAGNHALLSGFGLLDPTNEALSIYM